MSGELKGCGCCRYRNIKNTAMPCRKCDGFELDKFEFFDWKAEEEKETNAPDPRIAEADTVNGFQDTEAEGIGIPGITMEEAGKAAERLAEAARNRLWRNNMDVCKYVGYVEKQKVIDEINYLIDIGHILVFNNTNYIALGDLLSGIRKLPERFSDQVRELSQGNAETLKKFIKLTGEIDGGAIYLRRDAIAAVEPIDQNTKEGKDGLGSEITLSGVYDFVFYSIESPDTVMRLLGEG